MLKKLLKYDLKSMSNTIFPIYGLTLLLALLSRIFIVLSDITPVFKTPMALVTGLALLISIGIIFVTFVIAIDKFNKQMTKDEGYLTHTLPVKKQTIIGSKLITQILFQIGSLFVSAASLCIIGDISFNEIKDVIEAIFEIFTEYRVLTPTLVLLTIFIGYTVLTLLIYTAISFGQRHATNKSKFAILYGVILYVVQQVVTATLFMPLLANESFIEELEKTLPKASVLNLSLTISITILAITAGIYYFLTTRNLEKKLNLE